MKKFQKTFVVLALFLCFPLIFNAQHSQTIQHSCGTHATPEQIDYLDKTTEESQRYVSHSRAVNQVAVRHIILRRSDGTGGISNANLTAAMNNLNNIYAAANIQFYECSRIYVDDDTYFNFNSTQESALAAQYEVSNAINVFHCNTVRINNGNFCGYAYFPSANRNRIVMDNSCTINGSTFPHEFGHFFGLPHTHGFSNNGTTNELVNGSNCSTAGDRFCDTPADPNLSGKVNSSCVYTGTDRDANNQAYQPQTNNLMSYSRKHCRNFFSTQQLNRIRYSVNNEKTNLNCNGTGANYPIVSMKKKNAPAFAIDGGNGGANGQNAYLWTYTNSNVNQKWVEIPRGNGFFSYQKLGTNYCLDGNWGGANGQNVYIWTCGASNVNQQWKKTYLTDGSVQLTKRNSTYNIDGNWGGANGQNLYLWSGSQTNQNQAWNFSGRGINNNSSSDPAGAVADGAINDTQIAATKNISCYPNPFTGTLTIQLPNLDEEQATNIRVVDLMGRTVVEQEDLQSGETVIISEGLSNGVYFVQWSDTNGKLLQTKKVIKQ